MKLQKFFIKKNQKLKISVSFENYINYLKIFISAEGGSWLIPECFTLFCSWFFKNWMKVRSFTNLTNKLQYRNQNYINQYVLSKLSCDVCLVPSQDRHNNQSFSSKKTYIFLSQKNKYLEFRFILLIKKIIMFSNVQSVQVQNKKNILTPADKI